MSGENFPVNNANVDTGANAENTGNAGDFGDLGAEAKAAEVVEKSEKKISGKRFLRRGLAAALAIASLTGAGCSKNNKNKQLKPEDIATQESTTMDPALFHPMDSDSDDVTFNIDDSTPASFDDMTSSPNEIGNRSGLPEVIEAEPEQVRNRLIYNPNNTKVNPGINQKDYLFSEKPIADPPVSPNGHFNISKLCEDLGIDKSEINVFGGGKLVIGDTDARAVVLTSDFKILYYVDGKLEHCYDSSAGKGLNDDGMSFYVKNEDGTYEYGSSLHFSETTIGVLELMLRAYTTGDANPFD